MKEHSMIEKIKDPTKNIYPFDEIYSKINEIIDVLNAEMPKLGVYAKYSKEINHMSDTTKIDVTLGDAMVIHNILKKIRVHRGWELDSQARSLLCQVHDRLQDKITKSTEKSIGE